MFYVQQRHRWLLLQLPKTYADHIRLRKTNIISKNRKYMIRIILVIQDSGNQVSLIRGEPLTNSTIDKNS
jgi:hypothetical protein